MLNVLGRFTDSVKYSIIFSLSTLVLTSFLFPFSFSNICGNFIDDHLCVNVLDPL
jgi:hypothetical protein